MQRLSGRQRSVASLFVFGWMNWLGLSYFEGAAMAEERSYGTLEVERPATKGEPTKIRVGVYVLDIANVNDAQQEFSADVTVALVWQDDRLAHGSPEPRRTASESIWHPRIVVYNARQITRGLPEEVIIADNGLVTYTQRFTGTFSAPLDLHNFPRDEQLLRLQFVLQGLNLSQVELTILDEATSQAPKFAIADWHVEEGLAHIAPIELTSTTTLPGFSYQFKATRDVQFYRLKIISTLILIVLMSWSAFWMTIGDVAPKLAMGSSSMLTLIAYRFYLSSLVPRISYMTLMDYFVMGITVLVSATLVGSLLINYQHQNGRIEGAKKIQFWSRVAFPVALAILIFMLEFSSISASINVDI